MAANLRFYLQLLAGKNDGKTPQDIAKELGKNPYFVTQVMPFVQKAYTFDQLRALFHHLAKTDLAIKSGKIQAEAALQIVFTRFYR